MMKFLAVVLFSFAISISYAQQKRASVKGYILDDNNNPLGKVSVFILGQNKGTFSNDSGYFLINILWGIMKLNMVWFEFIARSSLNRPAILL